MYTYIHIYINSRLKRVAASPSDLLKQKQKRNCFFVKQKREKKKTTTQKAHQQASEASARTQTAA